MGVGACQHSPTAVCDVTCLPSLLGLWQSVALSSALGFGCPSDSLHVISLRQPQEGGEQWCGCVTRLSLSCLFASLRLRRLRQMRLQPCNAPVAFWTLSISACGRQILEGGIAQGSKQPRHVGVVLKEKTQRIPPIF